jgi:ribosome biogenesis protein Tsr3
MTHLRPVRLVVLNLFQDDPKRCTAAKMAKHGHVKVVERIDQIPHLSVLLSPFSKKAFSTGASSKDEPLASFS